MLTADGEAFHDASRETGRQSLAPLLAFDCGALADQDPLDRPLWLFLTEFQRLDTPAAMADLDGVFCPSDELAWRIRNEFPELPVHVTGLPVCSGLFMDEDGDVTRRQLGAEEGQLVVFCREETAALSQAMDRVMEDERFFLITQEHLRIIDHDPCRATGRALSACDLMVAEPSAWRLAEALACNLPVVAWADTQSPYFQNALYLTQHGAGQICQDGLDLVYRLGIFASKPERIRRLREAVRGLSRTFDAGQLAKTINQSMACAA
ncbi:MAG: hypothetical protein RLY93_04980 [Sumerlaeia bacterium]